MHASPTVRLYLFREGSRNVLVCWTTQGSEMVALQAGARRLTVKDLFGNPRAASRDGCNVVQRLSEDPIYVFGIHDTARAACRRVSFVAARRSARARGELRSVG